MIKTSTLCKNKKLGFLVLTLLTLSFKSQTALPAGFQFENPSQTVTFIENKGQVSDQYYKARPDVLFSGSVKGMVFHLRNNGISYQLSKIDGTREEYISSIHGKIETKQTVAEKTTIYRLDISWPGSNTNIKTETDAQITGHTNYYSEVCPQGIIGVKTFEGVTYKNIYDNIDLHYYEKENSLKYDYLVAPHADYKQIKLKVDGAVEILKLADGGLLFKTPLGDIKEGAPLIYQDGKSLKAKWILKENVLSFDIENYDPALALVIDPCVRLWGTYYGNTTTDQPFSCNTDIYGNLLVTGMTTGASLVIATVGSHQSVYAGGYNDAYLLQFNACGFRQWATYYGGAAKDIGESVAGDASGNIYMAGRTDSTSTAIATSGCHQSTYGGLFDGFLVKFNNSGVRQWGTFYGGPNFDYGRSCVTDASGNVYLAGQSLSPSAISTSGAHQSAFAGSGNGDAYLVKFNSSGVRQWGTYYGGTGNESGMSVVIDGNGFLYLGGYTKSTTSISTPGCHQATFGGATQFGYGDAFLVKFDANGSRQWGTYYGGTLDEIVFGCATDGSGNVFIAGSAASSGPGIIASPGSHQTALGGANDAFMAKFDGNGVRQWGTYYGGPGYDGADGCATDSNGGAYLSGGSYGTSGAISTTGSHQVAYGGGTTDAFFVKFNSAGTRQWGTYYGGNDEDGTGLCTVDSYGSPYLIGMTISANGTSIATPGGYQSTFLGTSTSRATFIARFDSEFTNTVVVTPVNVTPTVNLVICSNNSTTLSATSPAGVNWFTSATSTIALVSGTTYATPVLTIPGTYTYYAEAANNCLTASTRIAITITVNPGPVISVTGPTLVCGIGSSATLTAFGANTYTWVNGPNTASNVITPAFSNTYMVMGNSGISACVGSAIYTVMVAIPPLVSVSGPTFVCGSSQTITLTASGANFYTWSTGNIGASIVITPGINSVYTVSGVWNLNGCTGSFMHNVWVQAMPVISVAGPSLVCKGSPMATLTASGATTYTWTNGPNTASTTVTPTVSTTYTVTGTIGNCVGSKVFSVSISPCLGLNNAEDDDPDLQIFPNPNTGLLNVVIPASMAKNVTWSIINSLGQIVMNLGPAFLVDEGLSESKIELDISALPAGVYHLRFEGPAINKTYKLLKD